MNIQRVNINLPGDRAVFPAGGGNTVRLSATDRGIGANWSSAVLTVRGYLACGGGPVTIATLANTDQGALKGPFTVPALDRVEVVVTTPQTVAATTAIWIDVEALITREGAIGSW